MPVKDGVLLCINHHTDEHKSLEKGTTMRATGDHFITMVAREGDGIELVSAGSLVRVFVCIDCGYTEMYDSRISGKK